MHLSAGDLLRAERDSGSPEAELINSIIMEGKIVPVRITVNLIKKAMVKAGFDKRFLIDGFPRSKENVEGWHDVMGSDAVLAGVLHFDADEQVMTERILKRAEASGPNARNDDNLETLKKRFA